MDSEDRIHIYIYINHIKVKWLKIHGYLPIDKLVRPRLFFGTATMQSRPQPAEFRWQVDCSGSFLRFDDPWDSTSQRGPNRSSQKRDCFFFMFFLGNLGDNNGKDFPKRFDLRILFGNRWVYFTIFYQLLEMMKGKHVPGKTTCLTENLVFQGWVHKGLYDIVCSKSTRMCARYVHLPLAFDRWCQNLEVPTLTQQRAMVIRVITDQIWVPPKNRMSFGCLLPQNHQYTSASQGLVWNV